MMVKYDLLIAGITIRLEYSKSVEVLPSASVPFLTKTEKTDIFIHIDVTSQLDRIPMSDSVVYTSAWEMKNEISGMQYNFYDKSRIIANLFVTYDYKQGNLRLLEGEFHDIIPPLHIIYPVLAGFLLRNKIGFFFHGSLVKVGEKGIVLTGESGAGKSTLSNLIETNGYEKIGDDRLILTLHMKNDSVLCHTTPFDMKLDKWVNRCCEVDTIISLSHSKDGVNHLCRRDMNGGMKRLILSNFLPLFVQDMLPKHFLLCDKIFSKILLYEYAFVPDNKCVKYLMDNI